MNEDAVPDGSDGNAGVFEAGSRSPGLQAGDDQAAPPGADPARAGRARAARGALAPRQRRERGADGAENCSFMPVDPLADLGEDSDGRRGDPSLPVRADVQHGDAVLGDDLHEARHDSAGALEVDAVGRVAPGVLVGVDGFPAVWTREAGDCHVAEGVVLAEFIADAAVDDGVGVAMVSGWQA